MKPIYRIVLAAVTAIASLTAAASAPTPSAAMLERLKKMYPNISFTEVRETPAKGIYEAVFGKDMLYVEQSGVYFFPTMVNMQTRENLGEQRRAELNKIEFDKLPLSDAIKMVSGNGSRKLVVFADPNCGYCKRLEANLQRIKDVTVYVFPVAILGGDSDMKVNAVTCSNGDKAKLWKQVVLENLRPVENNCGNGVSKRNMELFRGLGLQGTPAIVFPDGTVIKGFVENDRIEKQLGN